MQRPLTAVPTPGKTPDAAGMSVKEPAKGTTAPNHLYVLGLCSVAALGGFLFGFDSGVVNGAVNAISAAFGTKAAATGFAVASVLLGCAGGAFGAATDRKSTRLNSSHLGISYAVFCLKKKTYKRATANETTKTAAQHTIPR